MLTLARLVTLLWALVGSGITVVDLDSPPDWLNVNDHGLMQAGKDGSWVAAGFGCDSWGTYYYRRTLALHQADVRRDYGPSLSDKAVRVFAFNRFVEMEAHELAHGYDCLDNRELDGSPGHWQYVSADPYCNSNTAERYACAVVETRSLR